MHAMLPRISTRSAFADALQGWPPPVLDPAGPFAGPVPILAWVLLAMSALVLLAVIAALDRKSGVEGQRMTVRVDLGGRRRLKTPPRHTVHEFTHTLSPTKP